MAKAPNELQKERKYLEGLLATRVNYFLVFVSFYFVAAFNFDERLQRSVALALGGMISFILWLSVSRTRSLVEEVLDLFRKEYPTHPYTKAHGSLIGKRLRGISANTYISALPLIVTVVFFALAAFAWLAPLPSAPTVCCARTGHPIAKIFNLNCWHRVSTPSCCGQMCAPPAMIDTPTRDTSGSPPK